MAIDPKFGDMDPMKMFKDMKFPMMPDMEALLGTYRKNIEVLSAGQSGGPGRRPGGGQAAYGDHAADHGRAKRDHPGDGLDGGAAGQGGEAGRAVEAGL